MAVVATTLYSYFDQYLNRRSVLGSGLNDRGNWSSVVAYSPNDVTLYNSDLYIAVQASTNVIPTGTVTDVKWSPLVIVYEATPVQNSGSDSYARDLAATALASAGAAYTLAAAGTQIGSNAYTLAQAAHTLASNGSATLQLLINGSLALDRLILRDTVTQQNVVFVVSDGQFMNP